MSDHRWPKDITEREKFEHYVTAEPMSGCHLWMGGVTPKGYGLYWFRDANWRAHRTAWVLYRGDIPQDLLVLHKCDVRSCVNPDHLFLGTNRENILDAVGKGRMAAQKRTHCRRGHPFTGENLLFRKTGAPGGLVGRRCRTCLNSYGYKNRSSAETAELRVSE